MFAPIARLIKGLQAPESFSHRYVVMGPRGAGTTLHADFLDSSFWNACVVGSKHWVVFPATLVPNHITEAEYDTWASLPNVEWFKRVYPHLDARGIPYEEFTQRAGDVVWTPGGWPHQTINRQPSVTVTHNLILPHDAARVFEQVCNYDWDGHAGDEDTGMTPAHSVYLCLALARLFPRVYSTTCCASPERIDEAGGMAALSLLDFRPNSEYYADMLRRIRRILVHPDGSPVLGDEGFVAASDADAEAGSGAAAGVAGTSQTTAKPDDQGVAQGRRARMRRFDATLL